LDADAIQNPIISRPAPWKLTPLTLDQIIDMEHALVKLASTRSSRPSATTSAA
jgi:hypothetical protein